MSAAVTPARRLLALLEEESTLETRPRKEIDADLAVLGVDPAGPIRLARRLAEQDAGPAAALLGAMIEDESAEAEIAALESADIADVRSRLPAGTIAAVTAEAQRRAGGTSNVVGISRRRRGAVWAWTGSLVGLAACALIVVVVWWPRSEQASSPEALEAVVSVTEPQERRETSSESASQMADVSVSADIAPPSAPGLVQPVGSLEPAALESAPEPSPLRSQVAAGRSVQEDLESRRSSEETETPLSRLAAAPGIATPPLPPPTPPERRPLAESPAAGEVADSAAAQYGRGNAAEDSSSLPTTAAPAQSSADVVVENLRGRGVDSTAAIRGLAVMPDPFRVVDVLIVDPNSPELQAVLMPRTGAFTSEDDRADTGAPAGELSDRMPAARRTADGRPILALLALQSSNAAFDAVLVRREAGRPALAGDPTRFLLAHWFGDRAGEFALIALPPRP